MTGYDEWNGEYFVFCNIGIAGRSGHDYANRWDGKELVWFAKGRNRLGQREIEELVSGEFPVHLFWRAADRAPFAYAGIAHAAEVYDESPVRIVWAFDDVDRLVRPNLNVPPTACVPSRAGARCRSTHRRGARCRDDALPDAARRRLPRAVSRPRARRSPDQGGHLEFDVTPQIRVERWVPARCGDGLVHPAREGIPKTERPPMGPKADASRHLIERKQWMGGEFGRLGSDALSQLIEEFWSDKGR